MLASFESARAMPRVIWSHVARTVLDRVLDEVVDHALPLRLLRGVTLRAVDVAEGRFRDRTRSGLGSDKAYCLKGVAFGDAVLKDDRVNVL